jgi:negative regulator of sigma E activity
MPISLKCPHCKRPLRVNDQLIGKRVKCPACKEPLVVPAPIAPPADLEAFAAAALADPTAAAPAKEPLKNIEFTCLYCDEPVSVAADLAGKNTPCPSCRQIIKVPLPKADKPKDWRDIHKDGPAAARINLPEQLSGAWGTEAKSRVGRESLEEAGALPEAEIERVGVGGWLRRAALAAVVVGAVAVIVVAVNRKKVTNLQQDAIAQAREFNDKKKLHGILAATVDCADGVLLLSKDKREGARQQFIMARQKCSEAAKEAPLDHDLFLIHLALTQLSMEGNEDQYRLKQRYDWDYVQKEMNETLSRIIASEARVLAARELSDRLIARNEARRALTLVTALNAGATANQAAKASVLAQQGAIYFLQDPKKLETMIEPPDLTKKTAPALVARVAYAEGNARKGNLEEAKKLVWAEGPPIHQLEAAVGVASVILGDKNNKDAVAQATPFVEGALKIQEKSKSRMSVWNTYQLYRVALRIPDFAAKAKELAKELPDNFKRRAQLDWLLVQLEKGDNMAAADQLIAEMPPAEGPARGLAWVALGRQFTALGRPVPLPEAEGDNALDRVFANIGIALGKQER